MAEATPYAFGDRLGVVVDVKNPLCQLALAPTWALVDELGIEVDWLAMEHTPPAPPPEPSNDRGSEHRRWRALYRERDIERYAQVQGLVMRNLRRAADSGLANAGLLAARAHSPETLRNYLSLVCERHWSEALDIEDAAALEALLVECGVPASLVEASMKASRREYDALQAPLKATGVFTTPAYVFAGEVFYGREHLPMIRWLLTGRHGAAPI